MPRGKRHHQNRKIINPIATSWLRRCRASGEEREIAVQRVALFYQWRVHQGRREQLIGRATRWRPVTCDDRRGTDDCARGAGGSIRQSLKPEAGNADAQF